MLLTARCRHKESIRRVTRDGVLLLAGNARRRNGGAAAEAAYNRAPLLLLSLPFIRSVYCISYRSLFFRSILIHSDLFMSFLLSFVSCS